MPRSEIEKILSGKGGKGGKVSSTSGGVVKFTVNRCEGSNYKTIIISFEKEQLISKIQVG